MPPVMTIAKGKGSRLEPTLQFSELYQKLTQFLTKVFPTEENRHSQYPPHTAEEFLSQRFKDAPQFHRDLCCELWSLLCDISNNNRQVNRKTLHDHQFAHLIWVATVLTSGKESPTSFFIQGAPGTGKTLTLGVLMQACIRLQCRGLMEGKIAYCTAKPYHLADKIRGKGMGYRRVLRAPPYVPTEKDINRRRLSLSHMNVGFMKRYFPKKAWNHLLSLRPASVEEARRIVEDYLRDAGLQVDRSDEEMLNNVVMVLASVATTVRGPFGTTELLTFPPIPDATMQIASHTGDAAFAIPSDYPVFSRESVGVSNSTRGDARVVLEPATVFTSAQQLERFRVELHSKVQVLLCDEAQRRQPMAFQEPVLSAGAPQPPIVFAVGSQWYDKQWGCRSPFHSYPESIRRGVLPDLGVQIFPSADQAHFPSETEESLQQLLAAYFQPLKTFDDLGLPLPCDVNTLVVVHNRLVDIVVDKLRNQYGERGSNASVRPFHGDEEDREALRLWFDTEGDGPNVLVSSASIVKESLDLMSLRRLVVSARVSVDVLYHLIGRLAHGRSQRSESDRMLVTLQQFANSNLAATPFVALDHGQPFPDDGFRWLNGQALMSVQAFQRDSKRWKGRLEDERVSVPVHIRTKRNSASPIALASGTSLLPGHEGQVIDPSTPESLRNSMNRRSLIPAVPDTYDPKKGAPSRDVVRQWAAECGGLIFFDTYASIMISVVEAHKNGCNPRQTLEHKIAQLRERSHRHDR